MVYDFKERIPVYIIGRRGNYRNKDLLRALEGKFEIVEDDGFVQSSSVDIHSQVDEALFLATLSRPVTNREVACALAHIKAWRRLVELDLPYLAILEDDVTWSSKEVEILSEKLPSGKPWWLSLERRRGDFLWTHLLRRKGRLLRSFLQPRGGGAYLLSREAAILGLRSFELGGSKIVGELDRCPRASGLFRFYIQLPPPFEASMTGPSIIGARQPQIGDLKTRLTRSLRILASSEYPNYIKTGLIALKVFRPLKYIFSLHFAFAWLERFRRH